MYQTGSALDCNDLLDKLRLFLISAGWTIQFWGFRTASGQTTARALTVNKGLVNGTFLVDVYASTNENPGPRIHSSIHDAYVFNANPDTHVNQSLKLVTNALPGPHKQHYFFEGATNGQSYIHVVVEPTTGFFKHFGLGKMDCDYPLTNGNYCFGSAWYYGDVNNTPQMASTYHSIPWVGYYNNAYVPGTVVRADCDGVAPYFFYSTFTGVYKRLKVGANTTNSPDSTTLEMVRSSQPSTETGRAILFPFYAMVERPSGYFSQIGVPPDMRYVDMTYLEPATELVIGTDTWVVFPMHRKIVQSPAPTTNNYGYAFKKNV